MFLEGKGRILLKKENLDWYCIVKVGFYSCTAVSCGETIKRIKYEDETSFVSNIFPFPRELLQKLAKYFSNACPYILFSVQKFGCLGWSVEDENLKSQWINKPHFYLYCHNLGVFWLCRWVFSENLLFT